MSSYNIKSLVRDIERALEQAEAQTSAILRTAADAIISISSTGIVLSYNSAAHRMFGYSPEEMIGTNVARLMPSPYANEHDHYLRSYLSNGKARVIGIGRETIGRRQNGEEFPIDLSVSEVCIGDERTFTGIVRDLSDKKKSERMQAFLASLVESSVDAIIGKDLQGRIVSWNNSAESLYGYSAEEMIGKHISTIIPEENLPELELILNKLLTEKRLVRLDTVRLARSGRRIDVSLSISPILDATGQVIGASSISRDITELKRYMSEIEEARSHIERQAIELSLRTQDLERAQIAAESANSTKSQFLANMSHEIRTPITAILGLTEVVREEIVQTANRPDLAEHLDAVSRNGEYLLRLINDILDLSKLEAGRVDLEILPVSPHHLLRDVLEMLTPRALAKGITVELIHQSALPATLPVDPTRLRQILLNIGSNAIKFTQVGSVRIVSRLRGTRGSRPRWEVSVEDTGVGMSNEQIQRIFNPFVQGDNSTRRRFGGTGLGLTISKRLTESMGGSIRVESILDHGSRFTICIPLESLSGVPLITEAIKPEMPPPATSIELPEHLKILLAEDGIDNQRLIAYILRKKAKADVTIVDNGQEAVQTVMEHWKSGHPFDVVLMDMQMPILDGYEATRGLRQMNYQESIIAVTAHAMSDDRKKCLEAGCDDFITKPIDVPGLLRIIANASNRRRSTRPTMTANPLLTSRESSPILPENISPPSLVEPSRSEP
ncbi:PAS domain S-box protein [bacterium]|nr:PAS domain S-box protein [bacterium]